MKADDILPLVPDDDDEIHPDQLKPSEPEPDFLEPETKGKLSAPEIEKLITDNIKLAYWFAARWQNILHSSKEEIESHAVTALVHAANQFEPARGKPFGAYASRTIRNWLNHWHYHQRAHHNMAPVSLDAPVGANSEGDSATVGEVTPDDDVDDSDVGTIRHEAAKLINNLIDELEPQKASILRHWMKGESYRDMQKYFNISFVQIGNIARAAQKELRQKLKQRGVDDLPDIMPESLQDLAGKEFKEQLLVEAEVLIGLQGVGSELREAILS